MSSRTSREPAPAPTSRETDVEVDGIAELWYDDMESFQRAAASPEMKALTDDGALFIGQIKTYVIEERQIIPPPDCRLTASYGKRFTFAMFSPSIRSRRVSPFRSGECSTPTS